MRSTGKLQVLTTSATNVNGYAIHTDTIDMASYQKNPVLLYDAHSEDHGGIAVGKVTDIRRAGDMYVGILNFMNNYENADIAWEKYSQGVLNYVSIGGFGAVYEEDGVRHTLSYKPREISLVKYPANIECGVIEPDKLEASDREAYDEYVAEVAKIVPQGKEVTVQYLTMSAAIESITDKKLKEMEKIDAAAQAEKERIEAAAKAEAEAKIAAEKAAAEKLEQERIEAAAKDAAEKEKIEAAARLEAEKKAETERIEAAAKADAEAKAEKERIEAAAKMEAEKLAWHQQEQARNQNKFNNMTLQEIKASAEFNKRLGALGSAYRGGAGNADNLPENAETVKILASAMLGSAEMVILASRTNVTDAVSQRRTNGLELLINCAAGNAAAATLAAADLGVIKYLSLFYEKLLSNDTFRRSVRFVPMSDKTGAIYIEDNVQTPTYVGINTPINAPIYTYEDIKRTIARQVFSFSPILFQHSELAVLSYDKQSHGLRSTMASLMNNISTYWLQVIANTPGVVKQGTTGDAVATAGLFPIEAPSSAVNVAKPTLEDVIALQGKLMMQNFDLNERSIECVLPSNMFTMFASDEEVRNALTLEMRAKIAAEIDFSATRVTPRNPVCRYNTTSDAPELDPAMYADKQVADDGTATDITPATTTANHIGAGVAFVSQEVIAGIGAIELIVSPSPQNYGTVISGWVSTGCTVARENGKGVALFVPTVQ